AEGLYGGWSGNREADENARNGTHHGSSSSFLATRSPRRRLIALDLGLHRPSGRIGRSSPRYRRPRPSSRRSKQDRSGRIQRAPVGAKHASADRLIYDEHAPERTIGATDAPNIRSLEGRILTP